MQLLLELFPVAAFLVAYKYFGGMYVATAVLMGGMLLSMLVFWVRQRSVPKMFAVSTLLVLAFGAATLLLRDPRFIQWKPTIFLWALALAFLVSAFVGSKPLVQHMLQAAVGDNPMTRRDWLQLNAAWIVYGLVMGAVNLAVAFHSTESVWVNFKFYGLTASMFLFVLAQMFWLHLRGKLKT